MIWLNNHIFLLLFLRFITLPTNHLTSIRNYIKARISRNSYKLPNTTSMGKAKLCDRWWRCWWEKQSIFTCTEKTGLYRRRRIFVLRLMKSLEARSAADLSSPSLHLPRCRNSMLLAGNNTHGPCGDLCHFCLSLCRPIHIGRDKSQKNSRRKHLNVFCSLLPLFFFEKSISELLTSDAHFSRCLAN